MARVRPLAREDIVQVADLHGRVFGIGDGATRQWTEYFLGVYLDNPWRDEGLPSLVYEDAGGTITGFLGVMPRRMRRNGHPLRMAIVSKYMVDPARRGQAGLRLLQAFFDGPQDLSVTDEANDTTRRIWEGRGAATAVLHSIHWTRPLSAGRLALTLMGKNPLLRPVAPALRPLGVVGDALCARMFPRRFHLPVPRLSGEELSEEILLGSLAEFSSGRSLRPDYDHWELEWILERARRGPGGSLQKVLVRDGRREIAGWYLYYAKPGRVGEVLQIAAKRGSAHDILDHLFYHAARRDMVALSGRVDPPLLSALSDRSCLFHGRGPWMLVHSRRRELLDAIHRGDVFLTRLESEWWIGFGGPSG